MGSKRFASSRVFGMAVKNRRNDSEEFLPDFNGK
jgi:hypothetical protein